MKGRIRTKALVTDAVWSGGDTMKSNSRLVALTSSAFAGSRRDFLVGAAACSTLVGRPFVKPASAAGVSIKLGVLTDLSGPYADFSGQGCVIATGLAVEEFAREHPGFQIKVVSADHQNKADI